MLYKLVKKINGKEIVDSIDTLRVINNRKKIVSSSFRGQKVEFEIRPAEEKEEKYRKPRENKSYGGDYHEKKHKAKAKIKKAKRKNRK